MIISFIFEIPIFENGICYAKFEIVCILRVQWHSIVPILLCLNILSTHRPQTKCLIMFEQSYVMKINVVNAGI